MSEIKSVQRPNQDELEDKHCDSCDLICVLNPGL